MHTQDNSMLKPVPTWQTLPRVSRTLGMGSKQMAALLEITPKEYVRSVQSQKDPSARSLLQLCRSLNISFDMLMTDTFCYRTMARQFYGDDTTIPEKYVVAGKSKRRVLVNLLDFVEIASDWQRRLELMRFLQINEAALQDPNGTINLRCTVEAIEWLERQSGNNEALENLGREIMLSPQNRAILADLKQCSSIYELYEAICFESGLSYRHFEKNLLWKIEKIVPGQKILIRGYLNEEVREQIGDRHIKSKAGSVVRAAMMSSAPTFLGWDGVVVRTADCFTRRENVCELEVDISQVVKSDPRAALSLVH